MGKFAQTGFGFSCMKKAFELDVNGYLRYLSTGEIEMNLEGNEYQVINFYQWCLQSQETSAADISAPFNHFNGLNEFEIINSL
jgi:acylphosphatase